MKRPDIKGYIRYIFLGIVFWLVLAVLCGSLPRIEAKPVIVHGGLPDPMPEVERLRKGDAEIVVEALSCESPYEPVEGIVAVAWVIRTRVEQKNLTYEQVVKEPYQFSCLNPGIPRTALSKGHYLILKWIAEGVISGELGNPFPGATHYFSSCLISPPFWAYKMTYAGQIGCHRFYR